MKRWESLIVLAIMTAFGIWLQGWWYPVYGLLIPVLIWLIARKSKAQLREWIRGIVLNALMDAKEKDDRMDHSR